jgi:NitT/TauT family transport system substrate-binding protein
MRKRTKSLLAAACCLIAASWPRAGHAQPEKSHIAIGSASLGLTYLPLIIAEHQGYFKQAGLDVEVSGFPGGSKALEALMGGSIDVASGAYSNTLTMAARGQKLIAFAEQVGCPGFSLVVGKGQAAKFHSLADLKGMKIGVSAPGSSSHMVLNFLLKQGGVAESDVAVIGVGSSSGAVAAVRSGQIDAMLGNEPIDTMLEESHDAIIFTNMRSQPESDKVFGGQYPEASFYARADFIARYPKTVQAIADAVVRAERWLTKATPEQVADAVPGEYLLGDRALYIKAFTNMRSCLSPNGLFEPRGVETVLKILNDFNESVRGATIKLDETYDNSFVQHALAAAR